MLARILALVVPLIPKILPFLKNFFNKSEPVPEEQPGVPSATEPLVKKSRKTASTPKKISKRKKPSKK